MNFKWRKGCKIVCSSEFALFPGYVELTSAEVGTVGGGCVAQAAS